MDALVGTVGFLLEARDDRKRESRKERTEFGEQRPIPRQGDFDWAPHQYVTEDGVADLYCRKQARAREDHRGGFFPCSRKVSVASCGAKTARYGPDIPSPASSASDPKRGASRSTARPAL